MKNLILSDELKVLNYYSIWYLDFVFEDMMSFLFFTQRSSWILNLVFSFPKKIILVFRKILYWNLKTIIVRDLEELLGVINVATALVVIRGARVLEIEAVRCGLFDIF